MGHFVLFHSCVQVCKTVFFSEPQGGATPAGAAESAIRSP